MPHLLHAPQSAPMCQLAHPVRSREVNSTQAEREMRVSTQNVTSTALDMAGHRGNLDAIRWL